MNVVSVILGVLGALLLLGLYQGAVHRRFLKLQKDLSSRCFIITGVVTREGSTKETYHEYDHHHYRKIQQSDGFFVRVDADRAYYTTSADDALLVTDATEAVYQVTTSRNGRSIYTQQLWARAGATLIVLHYRVADLLLSTPKVTK